FGVGEQDGFCYYVMQLIDGRSLAFVIRHLRANDEGRMTNDERRTNDQARMTKRPEQTEPSANGPGVRHSSLGILSSFDIRPSSLARWVARLGRQAAEALAYAHAQNVLHRDVKPSNLLLDARGTVWVTDFGVAKLVAGTDLTGHGELVGTLKYMPPERFGGTS